MGRRKSTSRRYQVPVGVDREFWDRLSDIVWCDMQGKRIRQVTITLPMKAETVENPPSDASEAGGDAGLTIESAASEEEDETPLPIRQEADRSQVVNRSVLAAAPCGMQKQMLYDKLLPLIQAQCSEGAETIADDMMGLDNSDIIDAIENPETLKEFIAIQLAAVMEMCWSFAHEGYSLAKTDRPFCIEVFGGSCRLTACLRED